MNISAYYGNNKLIEGKAYTNKNNETFIINNYGEAVNIKDVKTYRIYEELDPEEVQTTVDQDLNDLNVKDNKSLLNLDDAALENIADKREKELKTSGLDIKDNEYKQKFIDGVKAEAVAKDAEVGNISDSKAFEKVLESEDNYTKVYAAIDKYTENTKIFNESELLRSLCENFNVDLDKIKGKCLSESVKNIIKAI